MFPFSLLAGRLAAILAPLLAAAAVSFGAWGLYERGLRMGAEKRIVELRLEHQVRETELARRAAEALEARLVAERRMSDEVTRAEKEYAHAIQNHRSAAAGARSDADFLRQRLAEADAARRAAIAAAGGTCPADSGDASARGDLLADALRLQAELAAAAERHAAAVRALQQAWPGAASP